MNAALDGWQFLQARVMLAAVWEVMEPIFNRSESSVDVTGYGAPQVPDDWVDLRPFLD